MIEFEMVEGKLVADPGQAGLAAAEPLARMLGLQVIQPSRPGLVRVRCMMTIDEYNRHMAIQNRS